MVRSADPTLHVADTMPAIVTTQVAQTQPAAPPDVLALGKFSIVDGEFGLTDRAVKPTAELKATVNGNVQAVTWGKPADPIKLMFTLKSDGIVDEAKIEGTAAVTPDSAAVKLAVTAMGLKQGALASVSSAGHYHRVKGWTFPNKSGCQFGDRRQRSGQRAVAGVEFGLSRRRRWSTVLQPRQLCGQGAAKSMFPAAW